MKKNINTIVLIFSLAVLTFPIKSAFAQMNQTFEEMFNKVLIDDIFYDPGFIRIFDESAAEVNSTLVPALNSFIASNVSSFPLTSTVAGVSIDLSAGTPELTLESLGPIYSETAETIGKNKLYIGANYSYYNLSQLRGLSTDDIRFTVTAPDFGNSGVLGDFPSEVDVIDFYPNMNISANTFVFYSTYGLFSNFDIGLAIPMVNLSLNGDAKAVINSTSFTQIGRAIHNFNDDSLNPELVDTYNYDESITGLGDVAVRLKYSLRQQSDLDFAAFLEVRFPTGDEENFLGTGKTNARLAFITSKKMSGFTPHLNLGYKYRGADFESDRLEYAFGFDQKMTKGLTFVCDLMGEIELEENSIELLPGSKTLVTPLLLGVDAGQGQSQRQIDLTNIRESSRDNVFNTSVGVKYAPSENFALLANVLVPMNDGGLRSSVAPLLGFSFIF